MAKRGPKGPSKYTQEFIEAEADALIAWYEVSADNIFKKDFAISRKYCAQRLTEFANVNEKFSDALNRAGDIEEMRLVNGALKGKYNAYFAGLTLKNVAGWRDKVDTDMTSKGEKIDGIIYNTPNGKNKFKADN